MTRARANEMLASEQRKFDKLVTEFLISIGAKPNALCEGDDRYLVDTKYGPMYCVSNGDWVHCRFEDVARAVAAGWRIDGLTVDLHGVHLNPYSGKWNHHYGRCTAADAFNDFRAVVGLVLPSKE